MQDNLVKLLASLCATLGAYGLYKLLRVFYYQWRSPLILLPGPPRASAVFGNMAQIMEPENSLVHEQWPRDYGKTIKVGGMFGLWRLYTTDPKALNHILAKSEIYRKAAPTRYILRELLGNGLVVVEGEEHKLQRRVMNPAFSTAAIRELTDIFVETSVELRDVLMDRVTMEPGKPINLLPWLGRVTLEIIGNAGFAYPFNALTPDWEHNDLHKAFSKVLDTDRSSPIVPILRAFVPALRFLPAHLDRETTAAKKTMDRIAKELLERSKVEMNDVRGSLKGSSVKGKNLLALLLRANMATDLPHHQRMSEEEVLAQVPTFLVAGHETTSAATAWALYSLSRCPEVQDKLRKELSTLPSDSPTMDELNGLPYLDAVIRETLRLHPPIPATSRVATSDDEVPLLNPYTDTHGRIHTSVHIRKGQTVVIPIEAINRDKTLWGEDALEFRPDRWSDLPAAVSAIPNAWGNMLTFLAGPRACIGYRFSLAETKAILFTLLRAFE